MASRCLLAPGPLGSKSHTPPPKSAPPMRAYKISETSVTMATRSSRRMLSLRWLRCSFPKLPLEKKEQDDGEKNVNGCEGGEGDHKVLPRRHGFACLQY